MMTHMSDCALSGEEGDVHGKDGAMRTRRVMVGVALLIGVLPLLAHQQETVPAVHPKRILTVLDLVGADPRGYGPSAPFTLALRPPGYLSAYTLPGSAASASAQYLASGLARIAWARWRVCWNPMGDRVSGLRLTMEAPGFGDPAPDVLGEFTGRSEATPIHTGLDITVALQAAQGRIDLMGTGGYAVQRLRGQPIVFSSAIEIVWELE